MGRVRVTVGHAIIENVRIIVQTPGKETGKLVKAVGIRSAFLFESEVPLAADPGGIAELFQRGGHRGHSRCQSAGAAVSCKDGAYPGIARIASGQQRGTGGRAHGRRGIHRLEQHALCRHLVDAGRFEILRAHAAEVAVALIVSHDKNDVRFSARSMHTLRSFPRICLRYLFQPSSPQNNPLIFSAGTSAPINIISADTSRIR